MPSSKSCYLFTHTLRRRTLLIVFLAITLVLLYPLGSPLLLPAPATPLSPSSPLADSLPLSTTPSKAKDLSAYELLSRPVTSDLSTIPKIIHQTWFPAGTNMSDSAKKWVETVKSHHPDWEYVLWDDESDEMLVKTHFPWFLETYKSLPKEINRADMARNFYMFLFGGMYADVDTEALRPVNSLFASHDVALAPHLDILSSSSNPASSSTGGKQVQRAFMGRMAHTLDPEGLGAIPNGWMASPPGHPFWLLPVLSVLSNPKGDGSLAMRKWRGSANGSNSNWIFWSNLTILFNKWILESTPFPILLTTWHLAFATLCTQLLSRTTTSLFPNNTVKMTPTLYITKIAPIALLYSGSLVCSNMAYVYLNVGFIQMLKASGPVITLLTSSMYGVTTLTTSKLVNVGIIAGSVALTVVSEIRFSWVGVAVQLLSLVCDACRLVLLQVLTGSGEKSSGKREERGRGERGEEASSSFAGRNQEGDVTHPESDTHRLLEKEGFDEDENATSQSLNNRQNQNIGLAKMDPLLSLYYTAPICALLNGILAWRAEVYPLLHSQANTTDTTSTGGSCSLTGIILETGLGILLLNAIVGFMLNVAVFTLIGKTSGLTMTLVSIPKNILLILASVVLFGTQMSLLQGVGYAGALAGLVIYAGGGNHIRGLWSGVKGIGVFIARIRTAEQTNRS
ncbi:hypothetical protein BDV06DRAFT_211069 [Aspergillus oleicola]